jgi:hypothetical protein
MMAPSSLFLKAAVLAAAANLGVSAVALPTINFDPKAVGKGIGSGGGYTIPSNPSTTPDDESPYDCVDTFQGDNFLDGFNLYTDSDPTNGFVNYKDLESAKSSKLIEITKSKTCKLGVDTTKKLAPGAKGRSSVRLESKKSWDKGLFIVDIVHMPEPACGLWPAMWTVGKNKGNWPNDGEIDIIEYVNHLDNSMALHTGGGECKLDHTEQGGGLGGDGVCDNSYERMPFQYKNQGCSVSIPDGDCFGSRFNQNKGGVYAMVSSVIRSCREARL